MIENLDEIILSDLRSVRAEIAAVKAAVARIETALTGLSSITIGLVGAIDRVAEHLLALEQRVRPDL